MILIYSKITFLAVMLPPLFLVPMILIVDPFDIFEFVILVICEYKVVLAV